MVASPRLRPSPLPLHLPPFYSLVNRSCINQTENPRRWGRVGESERESEYGNTTVVLPYVGDQMLNFILI